MDGAWNTEVFHVNTPHALTRAAGHLKYNSGRDGYRILFRGQDRIYDGLSPSLYRNLKRQEALCAANHNIDAAMKDLVCKASLGHGGGDVSNVPDYAREGLLQHYGLKTRWLDLVDNIWVALWFACYQMKISDYKKQFAHFEKRDAGIEVSGYSYILLIRAGSATASAECPGLFEGTSDSLLDLRVATPSLFLRPHAQHALVFRVKDAGGSITYDYRDSIAGVIRVRLSDALSWLGHGGFIGCHAFFPPPFYDIGYRHLLDCGYTGNAETGHIHYIGP